SPERTAWAVVWIVWPEWRIRCAQPGAALADRVGAGGGSAAPPTVPMVEVPPVAPNPALTPSEKLDLTLAAARRSGDIAALPAARPTRPRPDARPDAPDWPSEPRLKAADAAPAAVAPPRAAAAPVEIAAAPPLAARPAAPAPAMTMPPAARP